MTTGIACPSCGSTDSSVTDSRPRVGLIYRRRKCDRCEHRFATKERAEENSDPDHNLVEALRDMLPAPHPNWEDGYDDEALARRMIAIVRAYKP